MLNISLSEELQAFIQEQAIARGFNSASEYVYDLILREQERVAQQGRIELLLLEGLESGDPIEVTEGWWQEKQTQLLKRLQQSDA